jgi:thymidylate kinase
MTKYVFIEGISGSGKSSLAKSLVQHYANSRVQNFPTEKYKPLIKQLRRNPVRDKPLELELYLEDFYQMQQNTHDKKHDYVFFDRSWITAIVDTEHYKQFASDATLNNLIQPNLVLYLDVSSQIALTRIQLREQYDGIPKSPFENIDYLQNQQLQFRSTIVQFSVVKIIDANHDANIVLHQARKVIDTI